MNDTPVNHTPEAIVHIIANLISTPPIPHLAYPKWGFFTQIQKPEPFSPGIV
jgi:hypothetical protein